ncbi:MAG: Gfo/Idh/MocA family oxidoreductase [Bacteroidales bacterium]|nr:Gfo/Idh/MocA family oxidoreductase [Bacteroidales bacterium]
MSVKLAVIGVGNRTGKYLHYFSLHPDAVELVAVVDPDPVRREACRKQFSLPEDRCFASSDIFFDSFHEPCDGVIIGSPDRFHHAQALKAIERGWHILLEKPVAQSYGQCLEIAAAARDRGVKVGVCYVLRFLSIYRQVRELLESGAIGRVTGVSHREYVGIDRMLHTFVRGYWNRADLSAPSFVSKCCHDVDMLLWTTGATITDVQSAGSLAWYRPEPPLLQRQPAHCAGRRHCSQKPCTFRHTVSAFQAPLQPFVCHGRELRCWRRTQPLPARYRGRDRGCHR